MKSPSDCSIQVNTSEELVVNNHFSEYSIADFSEDAISRILKGELSSSSSLTTSIQQCPLKSKGILNKQKSNPPCEFSSLKVSKDERKFDLLVIGNTNYPPEKYIYEVIGGYSEGYEASIKAHLNGIKTCNNHNKRTFQTSAPNIDIVKCNSGEINFKCRYLPVLEFLKNIFRLQPKAYELTVQTCDSSILYPVLVNVYPDFEFSFKIIVDLTKKTLSKKAKQKEVEKTKSIGIEISGKYDKHKLTVTDEIAKTVSYFEKLSTGLQSFRTIVSEIAKVGPFDFEIEGPKFSFGLEKLAYQEIPGTYKVELAYTMAFNCDPLIGAILTFDILEALANAGSPAVAKIFTSVREWAEKNDTTVRVDFIINGRIIGGIEATKPVANPVEVTGKLGGELIFELKGEAKAKIDILIIEIEGAAELSCTAKFSTTANFVKTMKTKGVTFKPEVIFDGVVITVVVYGNISRKRRYNRDDSGNKPVRGSKRKKESAANGTETLSKKKERSYEWTLAKEQILFTREYDFFKD